MSVFEVYSYWNMKELQLVFNAIASIVGSPDYLGLLRTLAMVGLISIAMAVLAGFAQAHDKWRWLIMLAIFNGILLVPKVNVLLIDRTGTQAPVTVANVPLGLAAFANSVSHIGDWLTRTYETTFTVIPPDLSFGTHGALWGQRVQREMLHSQFTSSILQSNLLEFYRECVVPEYATGNVVASDMTKAQDIWVYLAGKTNPGRFVTIGAMAGVPAVLSGTYTCDAGYQLLTFQISQDTLTQINALGAQVFPTVPNATAIAAMTSAIQTSTNFILGVSMSATDAIKQTAMTNFMIDAQYNLPAQIGDAAGAAANLAQAQAIRSTSDSYKLMAKLSESTMPKIKNIVEIVQYSVFPIVMLLVLLAGHKGGLVIKAYVMSLFWVQLWPPLYAIMHMIMTLHAQELAVMTAGQGLAMADYSLLNNAYISDEAIAGMIAATAIPAIAAAIVKGGDVGAQAIMGAISGQSQQATQMATAESQGNISMGNTSLNNQSADNLSMGQYNAKPSINQGGFMTTGADGVVHRFGEGGRSETVDNSAAMQKIGADLQFGGRAAASLQKASIDSEKASLSQSTESGTSIAAAKQAFNTLDKGRGTDRSAQSADQTSAAAQTVNSYATETGLVNEASKGLSLNSDQKAEVEAHARAQATGGIHIPFVGGVDGTVGGGTSASSSSTTSQMNTMLDRLTNNKKYSDAVQKTNSAMHSDSFTTGDASTVKAASGIRANLDQSMSHVQKSQASHEKALAYQVTAARTDEQGASFSISHNNEFVGWMGGQINPQTKKGYTPSEVEQMARFEPERLGNFAQTFTDEKLVPELEKNMPAPTNNVAAQHEKNKEEIPGEAAVRTFNAGNQADVKHQQNAAGVNPNTGPENNIKPAVKKQLGDADTNIAAGKAQVDKEGAPIVKDAKENTDPSKGSNLARAAVNAFSSAAGSDATKLADRAGWIPEGARAAQATADANHGTLGENIVGAAIEVGSLALGGVGGKAGGAVLGKELRKGARDAAVAFVEKTDALAQTRLAEKTAVREGGAAAHALTPEAEKAAADAEASRLKALDNKASNEGAKAELGTESTAKGAGLTAGVVVGNGAAHLVTGNGGLDSTVQAVENKSGEVMNAVTPPVKETFANMQQAGNEAMKTVAPVIQHGVAAVKETNDAVLDTVSDLGNKANNLGHEALDTIAPKSNEKRP